MKKPISIIYLLLAVLCFPGLVGLAVFTRPDMPIRLNYEVDAAGMITLTRPDIPEQVTKLQSTASLPAPCLRRIRLSFLFKPGKLGTLAYGKKTCQIIPNARWDPEETAHHYLKFQKE